MWFLWVQDQCGGKRWPAANTSWIKFSDGFKSCQQSTGRAIFESVEVPLAASLAVSAGQPGATFGRLEDVRCWLATRQLCSGNREMDSLREAVAVLTRAPRPRQECAASLPQIARQAKAAIQEHILWYSRTWPPRDARGLLCRNPRFMFLWKTSNKQIRICEPLLGRDSPSVKAPTEDS